MGSPLFSSTLFSPLSSLPVSSLPYETAFDTSLQLSVMESCAVCGVEQHAYFFQTANCSSNLLLYLCGWCGRVRGCLGVGGWINYIQYVYLIAEYVYRQTRTRVSNCLTRSWERGDSKATVVSMYLATVVSMYLATVVSVYLVLCYLLCLSVAKGISEATVVLTCFLLH